MIPGFRYRRLLQLLLAMAMVLTVTTLPAAAKKADPPGHSSISSCSPSTTTTAISSPVRPGPVGATTPLAAREYLSTHLARCARATSTP